MEETLSQEEIDAFLEAIEYDEAAGLPQHQITLYDFKRPNRVSREQLRSLRSVHDRFTRNLSSQISSILHSMVEIQLHSVDQMTYGEFLMSLPNPTSFNVFSLKPLEGNGIIEINPSIAYPMLDIMMGGRGEPFESSREFSNIESGLFETILRTMMITLKDAWEPIKEVFPTIEAKESSPNVTQIVAQNEIVVMVVMEIIVGCNSGMVNICYPVITLEPILSRLASNDLMIKKSISKKSRNSELKSLVKDIEIDVSEEIILNEITLKDFKELKIGDKLLSSNSKKILNINGIDSFEFRNNILENKL